MEIMFAINVYRLKKGIANLELIMFVRWWIMIEVEHDIFYAKLTQVNGSVRINVPKKTILGAGYKVGDTVKVWMRKAEWMIIKTDY